MVSSTFPVFRLLGKSRFDSTYSYKAREKYPMNQWEIAGSCIPVFNFPYKSYVRPDSTQDSIRENVAKTSEELFEHIDQLSLQNCLSSYGIKFKAPKSLFVYTAIMDSFNHNYGVFDSKTAIRAAGLLAVVKSFVRVLEMRGLDDEYSLIVCSDHGGQWERFEDEICNHGCRTDGGNEGFLYIWNKHLKGNSEHWIKTEELAPTVAQVVSTAGVPLHATGHPVPLDSSST